MSYKLKSHSGAQKRFRGADAKHRRSNRSHINSKRSGRKSLLVRKSKLLSCSHSKKILKLYFNK